MAEISYKGIPKEVMTIILREQAAQKIFLGRNQYSLSQTLNKIVKEWKNKCKPVE